MRIGFCGTQSVGKSTLVKELGNLPQFKDYIIRTERSKYLRDLGIPLNTDSTLLGQNIFKAERSLELMNENILTDRTAIDISAFAWCSKTMTVGEKYNFVGDSLSLVKYYDYIFYVSPKGVRIEDNSVREIDPEYRKEIDKTIKNILKENNIKHYIIEGSIEERIKQVLSVIRY